MTTTPSPPAIPAGWYPDPDNARGFQYGGVPSIRYFDGTGWTDHRAPMQRRQPPPQVAPIVIAQQAIAPPSVVVVGGGTNHALHAVLAFLTCGLWLPVWLIIIVVNGGR